MATKRRVDNDDTTHLPSRLSGANSDNNINIARIAKLPYYWAKKGFIERKAWFDLVLFVLVGLIGFGWFW